jgi:hypothetical protein
MIRIPTSIQALVERAGLKTLEHSHDADTPGETRPKLLLMALAQNSSYIGLSTDGPMPLFIFHLLSTPDAGSDSESVSELLDCVMCMGKLKDILTALSQGIFKQPALLDTHSNGVGGEKQASDAQVTDVQKNRIEQPDGAAAHATHEAAAALAQHEGEPLDVNKGHVPKPLKVDDFLIVTDTPLVADALIRALGLENIQDVVLPLSDLKTIVGREKAVVIYVGKVKATSDKLLKNLVSKLLEVMSLCQGQLVMVVEVETDRDFSKEDCIPRSFDNDIKMLMEKAFHSHKMV